MKREELKALGLDDDTVNKVMEKYGESVNTLKTEADQLKEDKSALEAERDALNKNVSDYEEQLETVKKEAGSNKGLQERLDALKQERDSWKSERDNAVKQANIDGKTELALVKAKAHNPKIVMPLLDRDKIDIDEDGNLTGIDEQLAKIQEEDGYLFASNDTPPAGDGKDDKSKSKDYDPGGGQKGNGGKVVTAAERGKLKAAELWPEHYKKEDN